VEVGLVALAAFESSFHVQIIDLNWAFEVYPRRVQRPQEVLDTPIDRFVGNVGLHVKLSENGVVADIGVECEESFSESNC